MCFHFVNFGLPSSGCTDPRYWYSPNQHLGSEDNKAFKLGASAPTAVSWRKSLDQRPFTQVTYSKTGVSTYVVKKFTSSESYLAKWAHQRVSSSSPAEVPILLPMCCRSPRKPDRCSYKMKVYIIFASDV